MKKESNKVISIRLIYVILFLVILIVGIVQGIKYFNTKKNEKTVENKFGTIEQKNIQVSSRYEQDKLTSRSEKLLRNKDEEKNQEESLENTNSIKENDIKLQENVNNNEGNNTQENKEQEETKYISINEVKISKNMDLTVRTGLSREDFITLISRVKEDTSGFFEQNSGKIYDLCEEYSLNEIFFSGIISAESGWNIAKNHRNTHNYISLMSGGKLIKYSSVDNGLREAARVLHTNYLSKGGKYYYGKTLSAVKTKFCPASDTWVNLVYGRMSQIVK